MASGLSRGYPGAGRLLDRVLVLHQGRTVALDTPGRLKDRFGGLVRLHLVWRQAPPLAPGDLGGEIHEHGNRWSARLSVQDAQRALAEILSGSAYAALDDFSPAPPSLEDVLLSYDTGEET
ncbi:hypothetical protein [Actinomadura sp. B10D3]|uniref:hypothetical protein n=1 Tax=Actinomadura sp. B10D3 TaxID=3153557 RepID=UPI00325F8A82